MQILKGIKEVLALVGLTDDQTVRKIAGIRVHRVVARSIVVVVLVLWLMAIILIINQMQVKDFDEILRPLNFGFFSGCELISYLCLCRKTKQIDHLFDYMENVVNNRCKEDEEVVLIYETLHRTIENYLKTGMFAMKFAILLAYVTPTVIATLLYIFGWLSFDVYQLPLDLSFLFENKAAGFIFSYIFDIVVSITYCSIELALIMIYISVCLLIGTCLHDVSETIRRLNKNLDQRVFVVKHLRNIAELHMNCYCIMEMLEEIVAVPIFAQISTFGVKWAIDLLHLESTFTSLSSDVFFLVTLLMYITAENFCSCFFLTKMTHNGCLIGEIVYDVKWYELPIGDQRAIRRIVERSQKPFLFKGFGIIYYSLETFLKFIRSALSYFMLFRSLK